MKKGIVYCLKTKDYGTDGIYGYKIGCCKQGNIKNRLYYWQSKLKLKFDVLYVIKSNNIYGLENIIHWKLRGKNLCINELSGELFADFNGNIENLLIPYFIKQS